MAPDPKLQRTVLLVDDEENVLRALARALRRDGYQILTAPNARAGLDLLEKHSVQVIVSDQRMPDLSGVEFLSQVKERYPDTVRIVLTGYTEIDTILDAVNHGAVFKFFVKPWEDELLRANIREAFAYHEMEQENIRLQKELKESNRQLSSMNEKLELRVAEQTREAVQSAVRLQKSLVDMVRAVGLALEKRDPYTAGHQQRVAALAQRLGQSLGWDERRLEGLKLAALVHDIGKIYIPAEVLTRPTKLLDYEFALIKTHPRVGYDILKGIDFPWPIAETVLQHHERLDGSGYPQALRGDEVIPEARVLSVADVVEAIVSYRPYRGSLDLAVALSELRKHRGLWYDAAVVDACLALFDSGNFTFPAEQLPTPA